MLFLSIRIFVLVERLSLTIQKINACNKNEGSNDNLRKAVTEIVYDTCKRSWKKPVKYVGNASPENADSKKNQKSCCNCVMFFEKSRYVSCKLVKMKMCIRDSPKAGGEALRQLSAHNLCSSGCVQGSRKNMWDFP